jgi:hypothetical protein
MATQKEVLDFYPNSGKMMSPGSHRVLVDALPNDGGEVARTAQGIAIHEHTPHAYGFQIPEERKSESHTWTMERMLDRVLALDDQLLRVARPAEKQLVGVCDHFMKFFVGFLRAHGIPARGRYGFGSYSIRLTRKNTLSASTGTLRGHGGSLSILRLVKSGEGS